jgi:hypothetical protein
MTTGMKRRISLLFAFTFLLSTASFSKSDTFTEPLISIQKQDNQPSIRQRFRWKRVFRPIVIWNKPLKKWLLYTSILGVSFGSLLYASAESMIGLTDIFGLLALLLLALLAVAIPLAASPFIILYRIYKEIRWKNRYRRCPKG